MLPARKQTNKHLQCFLASVPDLKLNVLFSEEQTRNPEGQLWTEQSASTHRNWGHGSRAGWNISSWAAPPLPVGAELSSTQNPIAAEAKKKRDANRLWELGRSSQQVRDGNTLNDNQRKCIKRHQGDFIFVSLSNLQSMKWWSRPHVDEKVGNWQYTPVCLTCISSDQWSHFDNW